MKLSEDQKRLALLRFDKMAVDINSAARERLIFAKSNNLSRGWEPNDPKFFIAIAEVYAQFSSSLFWAFAESLFAICKESDLSLDDEMVRDLKAEISKKRGELNAKARRAAIGDPWGDSEGIVRDALTAAQQGIDQEIERLALEYKLRIIPVADKSEQRWILSLHGIRTRAAWQKELAAELNRAGFNCLSLDYGYFLALQLMIPYFRTKKLQWFLEVYTNHVNRSGGPPSIVAHSFGTYIVAGAIKRYSEIAFEKVIFAGAIVDRAFEWSKYAPNQVGTILNDCGGRDFWVALAPWLVRDAGSAGRFGFLDGAKGVVLNRFRPSLGHSEHFYDLNYVKSWVPFLRNGSCEGASSPMGEPGENRNWRFYASVAAILVLSAMLVVTWLFRHVGHLPAWLPSFLDRHHRT